MSDQSPNETYPMVLSDESDRDTETGVESTRTVLVEIDTWDSKRIGRRAVFEWDDDRDTYVLNEYEAARKNVGGWKTRGVSFRQSDVDALQFVASHLREATRGSVDIELFVGEDNVE